VAGIELPAMGRRPEIVKNTPRIPLFAGERAIPHTASTEAQGLPLAPFSRDLVERAPAANQHVVTGLPLANCSAAPW